MASQHTVRIEPLGKDNYDTWRIQMEALLVKSDSWSVVNGETAKPEAVEGNANAALPEQHGRKPIELRSLISS